MQKKNKPKNNSSFSMSLSEPFILWCVLACLVSNGFSAESLTWSWLKPLWEQFVLYRKAFYLNCWIVQNPELRVSKFRCVSKKPSPRSLKLQSETVLSLSLSPIIRPVLLIFSFFFFSGEDHLTLVTICEGTLLVFPSRDVLRISSEWGRPRGTSPAACKSVTLNVISVWMRGRNTVNTCSTLIPRVRV